MDPIRHVLAQASRRLLLASWVRHSVVMLTIALVLAAGARGAQKLFPTLTVEWAWVLPALVAASAAMAFVIALTRRPAQADVAQTVDERAGLRESLSTALCVEQEDTPWSRAIVDDAGARAKRVVVRDAVPIEAPGNSWWPVAACAGLMAVWWLPATDVAGLLAKQQGEEAEQRQVQEVAAIVNETQQTIDEILSKAGVKIEDDGALEDLFNPSEVEQISAAEMQRAAIKKLTQLSDKLEEQRNGEEGATFDAIQDAMKRMEQPEPGPASEMSRAMARGDFAEAKKQLEKLAEQVASGEMPEEQRKQLEKQLEQMSEAMSKMAANRQELEEQLREAGMSEQQAQQMAGDPSSLEKALQEMGLGQNQIDQLKKQAQAQQNASDAASAMSQAMGQMAQGMQNESQGQMSEGLESMSGQLSNMEQMQSEMQALEQAMGQCEGQASAMGKNPGSGQGEAFGEGSQWGPNGEYAQGDSMGQGGGSGRAGQGLGAGPKEQPSDFVFKNEKATVQTTGEGPVIASTLVYGSQIRGESTAAFSDAVKSAEAEAAEAIETKRVPREHEEAVKAYFGRLQKAANKEAGEPEKPAESGSDAGASESKESD